MTKSSQALNDRADAAAAVRDRDNNRDLLTVEQAAAFLQLSQSSVRRYIREGKLKAFRVAGLRKVLIGRAELMKLLELVEPA